MSVEAATVVVDDARTRARPPVRRIQPSRGLVPIDARELWRYRALLTYFIRRDVKSRYKQTFLGPLWAILRPLASMVLFSAIFGGLAGIKPGSDIPYPLFVYPGVLVFNYFSSVLTGSAACLLNVGGLMSKVYFPRLFAPVSAVTTPIVDFVIALVIVGGLFGYFGRVPSWHAVFLPAFFLLAITAGVGVGIWLAGVAVRYRDVQYLLPYATQFLMYATPVIYPPSFVPERYRWLLDLNPMTGVVSGFRWSLLGVQPPSLWSIVSSVCFGVVATGCGLFFFRRTERTIVDMI